MQDDELKIEKIYYSIGEVAEMFKVNTSLLRYWEKEFKMLHPKKNLKGERHYTKKDIESFRLIYQLVKEKGFTLNGAKQHLKQGAKAVDEPIISHEDTSDQMKQSLHRLKTFLLEVRKKIE
jgi:DNA-binding transcriptional MerR regulator